MNLLKSKAFLVALCLLIVNDLVLKYNFSNWFTGKLSDFTGLFVFALFWMAFLPKYKVEVCWITAIGFLWWKSTFAQSFIDYWNQHAFYGINRVVDYTDYIALVVLALALKYAKSNFTRVQISSTYVVPIAAFAFCATSAQRFPPYELPNPQVLAFEYKMDSSGVVEVKIPTTDFVEDSNGIYRYSKEHFKQKDTAIINNHIFLVNISDYDVGQDIDQATDRIQFLEGFKNIRKDWVNDYFSRLHIPHAILEDSVGFTISEEEPWPSYFSLNCFPIELSVKDTFHIRTNTFGRIEEMNFKNSLLHGSYTQYWDTTNVKLKGFYHLGFEEGEWEYFDSLGLKVKEEIYVEGEKIKETLFQKGAIIDNASLLTKERIILAHKKAMYACVTVLLVSLFLYFIRFKKSPPTNKKKGFRYYADHFFASFGIALCSAFVLFFLWLFFIKSTTTDFWNFPDFPHHFPLVQVTFGLPFSYFLFTRRYKDFLWILLWMALILMIYCEISFLNTFG